MTLFSLALDGVDYAGAGLPLSSYYQDTPVTLLQFVGSRFSSITERASRLVSYQSWRCSSIALRMYFSTSLCTRGSLYDQCKIIDIDTPLSALSIVRTHTYPSTSLENFQHFSTGPRISTKLLHALNTTHQPTSTSKSRLYYTTSRTTSLPSSTRNRNTTLKPRGMASHAKQTYRN